MKNIESSIKVLLAERDINMTELSKRCGTTLQNLNQILGRGDIKASLLEKVAIALNVSVNYFFSDSNMTTDEVESSLKHKIQLLEQENEMLRDKLKWREEKIQMLEDNLENFGYKKKGTG